MYICWIIKLLTTVIMYGFFIFWALAPSSYQYISSVEMMITQVIQIYNTYNRVVRWKYNAEAIINYCQKLSIIKCLALEAAWWPGAIFQPGWLFFTSYCQCSISDIYKLKCACVWWHRSYGFENNLNNNNLSLLLGSMYSAHGELPQHIIAWPCMSVSEYSIGAGAAFSSVA